MTITRGILTVNVAEAEDLSQRYTMGTVVTVLSLTADAAVVRIPNTAKVITVNPEFIVCVEFDTNLPTGGANEEAGDR